MGFIILFCKRKNDLGLGNMIASKEHAKMNKKNCILNFIKNFLIFLLYIVYIYVGGVIFSEIEGPNSAESQKQALQELKDVFHKYNKSFDDPMINEFMDKAIANKAWNITNDTKIADEEYGDWTKMPSSLFAFTIITTIGYGHITPVTDAGMGVTFIYGLIGFMYTGYILAKIGGGMASVLEKGNAAIAWCISCITSKMQPAKANEVIKLTQLVITVIIFFITFFIIPIPFLVDMEGWTRIQSFYYCFTS